MTNMVSPLLRMVREKKQEIVCTPVELSFVVSDVPDTTISQLFVQGCSIQGLSKAFKCFYGSHVDDISKFYATVTKKMPDAIPYSMRSRGFTSEQLT